jgi:hypothetical protein
MSYLLKITSISTETAGKLEYFGVVFQGIALRETYEGVSKSFRTGRLECELQIVQLSATRCSCIAVL